MHPLASGLWRAHLVWEHKADLPSMRCAHLYPAGIQRCPFLNARHRSGEDTGQTVPTFEWVRQMQVRLWRGDQFCSGMLRCPRVEGTIGAVLRLVVTTVLSGAQPCVLRSVEQELGISHWADGWGNT